MRIRKPTLTMVAEAAGVHTSTASRALDPGRRHLVASEVTLRVQAEAAALGYRRDMGAAALRTGRTRLVGVIVPDVANPVFGPILSGVEQALQARGYSAVVANAGGTAERAMQAAGSLIARRVEGLVLATAELDDRVVSLCLDERMPATLVNRAEANLRVPTVVSDDRAGMRLAVRHLAGLGHRAIAHLGGPQNVSTGVWRREGFLAAMAEAGLEPAGIVIAESYSRAAGLVAAHALLDGPRPTAIAAANDLLALGALTAISEVGMACPAEVAIVGYNDMPLVDLVSPPLTTIRISTQEMGRRAGEAILAAIEGDASARGTDLIEPVLVVRGSTARRS
jgi:LacI family transcriptional regulator